MVFKYLIHNLENLNDTLLCIYDYTHSMVHMLIPYILTSGVKVC